MGAARMEYSKKVPFGRILYKDYMFISNEEEETNGDSKNIRTESVKYKAFINNPYK